MLYDKNAVDFPIYSAMLPEKSPFFEAMDVDIKFLPVQIKLLEAKDIYDVEFDWEILSNIKTSQSYDRQQYFLKCCIQKIANYVS